MGNERVLILANGAWDEADECRRIAAAADYVIAADGGFARAAALGLRVDEVVGDLDSIDVETRDRLLAGEGPPLHVYPRDKDWTDLELAIEHALRRAPRAIVIFGALGRRIDHTLTNLHLLERGIEHGVPILLKSALETVRIVIGETVVKDAALGDRVSLVPLSETATVTTTGLRFPLEREQLKRAGSRGVSNEVVATPIRIHVHDGLLLMVNARANEDDDG